MKEVGKAKGEGKILSYTLEVLFYHTEFTQKIGLKNDLTKLPALPSYVIRSPDFFKKKLVRSLDRSTKL